VAVVGNARGKLIELGIREILKPFIESLDSEHRFPASLIFSLISSSQNGKIEPPATVPVLMVNGLNQFIGSTRVFMSIYEGQFLEPCETILAAIGSLATHQINLKGLKKAGIMGVIVEFVNKRKALKVIWILAFDPECKNQLLEKNIVGFLKTFKIRDHEGAQRNLDGALFELTGLKPSATLNGYASKALPSDPFVLISYSWAQKDKMRALSDYLKQQGIQVFIDLEKMEGSAVDLMAEAVEKSAVVLIGVSASYQESHTCRSEALYAARKKKPLVYLLAEDPMQGFDPKEGWLGAILGNSTCYNHSKMPEILAAIKKHLPSPSVLTTTPLISSPLVLLSSSSSSSLVASPFSGSLTPISVNGKRRVTIRKFGKPKGGKTFVLPDSLSDLLQIGGEKLGIEAVAVRLSDESEIDDIEAIRDGDILFLLTAEEQARADD